VRGKRKKIVFFGSFFFISFLVLWATGDDLLASSANGGALTRAEVLEVTSTITVLEALVEWHRRREREARAVVGEWVLSHDELIRLAFSACRATASEWEALVGWECGVGASLRASSIRAVHLDEGLASWRRSWRWWLSWCGRWSRTVVAQVLDERLGVERVEVDGAFVDWVLNSLEW
jgi:hypothetical protein